MKALRRALASFIHSEFLTVRTERDQAQRTALALERTVADWTCRGLVPDL